MDERQQSIPIDEEVERELEDAAQAFFENEGNPEEAAADVQAEMARTAKEETAKKYQDILIALGFIRYDNKEKGITYKLKVGPLQIGRTFTEKYPIGNTWVRYLTDCEHGKKDEFLKRDECKQIPQVALFYRIRDGELPIPEATVAGKVVSKSDKAIQIQFAEFGQIRTEWWGFGALKKNEGGTNYVPASYSKETEKYNAKMKIPRDIILENYEAELKEASLVAQTDTTEEKRELLKKPDELAKTDLQPTGKSTMGKVIKREPTEYTQAIAKYTNILAEVTEAIFVEDRIPTREKGYAVKFVYYSVIEENKKIELTESTIEAIGKAIAEKEGDQEG